MKTNLIAVCCLIAIQPVFAKDTVKTHKNAKPVAARTVVVKPQPPKPPWAGMDVAIAPCERHVIRAYVHKRIEASKGRKPNGLPPGLAKKTAFGFGSALPDEWRKTCVPGKIFTAEVHKHCQPLPHEIMIKLPPPPPGTVLVAVDGRVIRLAYPSYEILDIFDAH